MLYNLIVPYYLICSIPINLEDELDIFIARVLYITINYLSINSGSELLSIMFRWCKKGSAN
jgi:hypothetical protein